MYPERGGSHSHSSSRNPKAAPTPRHCPNIVAEVPEHLPRPQDAAEELLPRGEAMMQHTVRDVEGTLAFVSATGTLSSRFPRAGRRSR
ncbi:unnamed protein product [Arctogadus glacialis]